jgi:toxin ParE1/3/4
MARDAPLEFIADENPIAAERLDREIEQQFGRLKDHPHSGRVGLVSSTRELVIARTPYIAVYKLKGDDIEIIHFLHGAQRWPPAI